MRVSPTLVALVVVCLAPAARAQERPETIPVLPGANSHQTYFTMHRVGEAHALTKGKGAKIGILDHSFGFDAHPGLYAGGQAFQSDDWAGNFATNSHHGSPTRRTCCRPACSRVIR